MKERYFQVRTKLPPNEKEALVDFLNKNSNVFAWSEYEALGVHPEFKCHTLNVNSKVASKKQQPRQSSKEHAEVVKLKQARTIKEVFYLEWLANTIIVRKKSRKRRACVDFTDLNKAYPKDPFPIPRIDQLIDATFGHPRKSFLDSFQGYHQIPLALSD